MDRVSPELPEDDDFQLVAAGVAPRANERQVAAKQAARRQPIVKRRVMAGRDRVSPSEAATTQWFETNQHLVSTFQYRIT
jgi:hypothetical protein